jgi:hypothetical protein
VQIVYPYTPTSPGPNDVQIQINNRVFKVHAQS